MILWLALLLQGATPVEADAAGNRVVPFAATPSAPVPDGEVARPLHCTASGYWCAWLRPAEQPGEDPEGWYIDIFQGRRAIASGPTRSMALADPWDSEFSIHPEAIQEADGALIIRIERRRRTSFSGGWASASFLELVRAPIGADPLERLLLMPASGGIGIRACFDEDDQRARRGACHDEYESASTLSLDSAVREGRPRFIFEARARTYPGLRSRDEDNSELRLGRSDLVWTVDPVCSYRRTFSWDETAGSYAPDLPVPLCVQYFDF